MKRHPELIRDLLIYFSEIDLPISGIPKVNGDWMDQAVIQHTVMLIEGGFFDGIVNPLANGKYAPSFVREITWEGYELLEAIRDDDEWKKITGILEKQPMSISLIKELGEKLTREIVRV